MQILDTPTNHLDFIWSMRDTISRIRHRFKRYMYEDDEANSDTKQDVFRYPVFFFACVPIAKYQVPVRLNVADIIVKQQFSK